ncbi:MAG: chondroitinase-B domain-containing protein [Saprospiraceae bacterium]
MKKIIHLFTTLFILLNSFSLMAEKFIVNSQTTFNNAHSNAVAGDSIVWESGLFQNIEMDIEKSNLVIMAEELGETRFAGASKVDISGSYITFQGFQFIDGNIGNGHVINTSGSYNHFTQLNIKDYTSYKYFIIREECQYNRVTYCNFEHRVNYADQNILSILVDDNTPGYHKIQYCSFKNFDGTGNDEGVEPIRIGLSTQGEFASRSIVEFCYFTQCNGDGEIISNKARQNVFRYNTFEDNPFAELVLRHGNEGVVYGNFFLNGMGGVRVREGQHHVIFNNYFNGLTKRSIYLQNDDSDPLDDINIAFNTFINSEEIRLGGIGSDKPTNVVFSNNIFTNPIDDLFSNPTDTESWFGNISTGSLGMSAQSGISTINPELEINSDGFYELSETSPAIDAAQSGYPSLPNYPEMNIDYPLIYDLGRQLRPLDANLKDVGCSEYPHNAPLRPLATEENTGPSYLWDNQVVFLRINLDGFGAVSLDLPLAQYALGTEVTLTAMPSENYLFTEWSQDVIGTTNSTTIIMDDHKEVTAHFSIDPTNTKNLQLEKKSLVEVFPNPITDKINLSFSQKSKAWIEAELFNNDGKKVKTLFSQNFSSGNYTMVEQVKNFPSGIYYLYFRKRVEGLNSMEVQVLKVVIP